MVFLGNSFEINNDHFFPQSFYSTFVNQHIIRRYTVCVMESGDKQIINISIYNNNNNNIIIITNNMLFNI
jgi:hypothetical protein